VQEALAAGEISLWHANAIVDATTCLAKEQARAVADKVLPRARAQTVADLRRSLRRQVLAADPSQARKRAEQAKAERSLQWWATQDGMAVLRLSAPVLDVMAVFGAADAVAKKAASGHPVGSPGWQPIAARRADALLALVQGAIPGGIHVEVEAQVTIDLPTLLRFQDNPAELSGYGPLPAALARELAADARWRRLIYEPQTGALLDLGRSTYKPSAALARYIRARDRVCVFRGCNRQAVRCHLDHRMPHRPGDPDSGCTDRCNMHPLCLSHHLVKHRGGWTLHNDPDTGGVIWTSSTGRQYTIPPHDYRPDDPMHPGRLSEGIECYDWDAAFAFELDDDYDAHHTHRIHLAGAGLASV
jgi:Domain of unknown function (DUF222)